MILYYSLSGNTEYVAKIVAKTLNEDAIDLKEKMKNGENCFNSSTPFLIFSPVLYMNVPKELIEYLKDCYFNGSDQAVIVLTASYSAGNARGELIKILKGKGLKVVLTNVFYPPTSKILGLTYPKNSEKLKERATQEVEHYAVLFKNQQPIATVGPSLIGLIGTEIGKLLQKNRPDKKFNVDGKCDGCGECALKCPRGNIRIVDGKPVFSGNCNHCSACINACPTEALNYEKITIGRERRK